MKVYIHHINPHYSATWADWYFNEKGRWNWMICNSKELPLEPAYNFGCLICCENISAAIDSVKKMKDKDICDSWEVIPPNGSYGKPATDGPIYLEYKEYTEYPERFDTWGYDPQNLNSEEVKRIV